jgi:anti-sigma factor RsiW
MNCLEASERMSLSLDALISSDEECALQGHVAQCEACQIEWQGIQAVAELFSTVQPVAPPPDFALRVMTRVQSHNRRARMVRQGSVFALGLVVLATLGIIPVMTMITLALRNPSVVQALSGAAMNVMDVANTLARAIRLLAGAMLSGVSWPMMVGYVVVAATLVIGWVGLMREPTSTRWEQTA